MAEGGDTFHVSRSAVEVCGLRTAAFLSIYSCFSSFDELSVRVSACVCSDRYLRDIFQI